MVRALIAIGVNVYDFAGNLDGAERDAQQVHEILTNAEFGNYDTAFSRLLLSPTLDEVRRVVEEIVLGGTQLDELTVFFAGHGLVQQTGFYMGVRDTRVERATATAYSLGELFTHIAEAAPDQTNIILDACFSGGLAADLKILTRTETSGYVGSPAVTLLAMSARNQEAGEFPDGGIGTTALLDCIRGRALVREDVTTLDLHDIGKIVIERVRRWGEQNPVLSAINVQKPASFCLNPLFQASARNAMREWEPRRFLDAIEPVLAVHAGEPIDLIADIERIFQHLIGQADASRDLFKGIEVRATAIVALLRYVPMHGEIHHWLAAKCADLSDEVRKKIQQTVSMVSAEADILLAGREGLANLFLLPIRLSKLVGWSAAAYHLDTMLGREASFPRAEFQQLMEVLLQHYGLSFIAMSDVQAPYLAVALTAAGELGLLEQGEALLSSTFNSFVECQANVADSHIDPSMIFAYLQARAAGDFQAMRRHLARPTELGTVLLMASKIFDLDEIFDLALSDLDHVHINAFIADDYSQFAQKTIEVGENVNFTIGHDVWAVDGLIGSWPDFGYFRPGDNAVACGAVLASLLFPDRVPWFLFPKFAVGELKSPDTSIESHPCNGELHYHPRCRHGTV